MLIAVLGLAAIQPSPAQSTDSRDFVRPLARDEVRIFSSPARIHKKDWKWIVPLAGATVGLLATDNRNLSGRIHTTPGAHDRAVQFSNFGLASLAVMPLAIGWDGWRQRDCYEMGTAVTTARAVTDSLVATEILRLATRRERPSTAGAGGFFKSDAGSASLPSMHAASAWAIASVVSERHPGWLTRVLAYGLASGVSISRVVAKEHAPSDVLVGSALGLLIGRFVSHESRPAAPSADWLPPRMDVEKAPASEAKHSASAYVPMTSWIYPALDRLAAMGLVPSQTSGLRPWTRTECRRQTLEAQSLLEGREQNSTEASNLIALLREELDKDGAVTLESVYVREGEIAGPALTDSFHFGQTWSNNLGRPFGRGWNSYTGLTARFRSGAFFGYVNGEYQHAPGTAPYSPAVRQTIAGLDAIPVQAGGLAETNRFRTLDAYVGARVGAVEVSIGKQSLWWGPTADSPLSFGNNAEPTQQLKVSTAEPFRLPGFLHLLGAIRAEAVLGKLGGQKYTWRPWFNAEKISFKLTDNLEMGFTRWSIFWGVGHPITMGSLLRNLTSTNSPLTPDGVGRMDPGDRKGGFDFRYRIPRLRNWVTLYSDSYCDDDPSPLAAPRRAAINPGIYLTHVPGIERLDLRVEAPSTTPMEGDMGGTFIYYNSQYKSGNTNYGYLVGNAIGRDARAIEARTTYWFSGRTKLSAGYRQAKGGTRFLPGGSTQTDATVSGSLQLAPEWQADMQFQYERFWVPLLGDPRRNLSAWLQFTWQPNLQLAKKESFK
jgi:membrane-associated phospholipid phosphatase